MLQQSESQFCMRPTSAEADAARILGTGRRWRNWSVFRLAVLIDPMMSVNGILRQLSVR
ncbi:hypothetical protein SBA1_170062 [Candidatus Sulfotelmatobacter kueseliae]|uniref:Uncharacterized protein n=1 Tax=Candidatus Sulfotelmatobacter kueseliae TaxID=2042962 RepID=A0A2U3KBA7_9BACT|nr:hypothetical protein SBA1_170062 [Candidatus Sulfotelmatobacter kueseliae]